MSSTSGFEQVPRWKWPEDLNQRDDWESSSATSSRASSERASANSSPLPQRRPMPYAQTSVPREETQRTDHSANTRQKHWRPRQCRICLETVQPTFNVPSENLPGFLQSTGNVKYEDENGRLLRPCLCKGSAKYVHEACLQAWRHADPGSRRNFWQCPTCKFKYRLARLGVGNLIGSKVTQIFLTVVILVVMVFLLGFVADPIINMYVDPWSFFMPWKSYQYDYYDDDYITWYEHFAKGFASMGVLGFVKTLLARPWHFLRFGGGRGRQTARDRYEQVGWVVILIGVGTFLYAIYKGVRAWSARALEKAGEGVMDIHGDDDDDDDE